MREGWKQFKLGELLEIKYGKDHKKLDDGKYPLYGSGGIMRYVDKYLYDDESILIPRKGTLTNLFYLNTPFSTVDTMFWSKIDKVKVFPKFLYYLLKTFDFSTLDEGAAIPSLTTKTLNVVSINIPESKETQRKIASILSGYDDLIENNLKRIKILEEMAQQTYEEWFVRMLFPGYETAVMNEETGLPEDWEKGTLENITSYLSGFAFKSAQFKEEGNGVIRIKNIGNNTINLSDVAYVDDEYAVKQKRYLLKSGDLLIAMTGATIGKVGIMPHSNKKFYLNQRVGKFVTENTAFLNCFFNSTYGSNQINNIAGGAAQPNISAQQILDIELNVPSKDILNIFSDTFNKGISMIINLQSQNQRLRESRDILLPRLMMGMIEV